jgi:hypothetical protein
MSDPPFLDGTMSSIHSANQAADVDPLATPVRNNDNPHATAESHATTNQTPSKLYQKVFENIDQRNVWDCQLFFSVSTNPADPASFRELGLMSLLVPEHRGTRYYFDPTMYSPENGFKDQAWKTLKNGVQQAAQNSGYELQSNGGGNNYKKLRCTRGKVYKKKLGEVIAGEYRQHTMHNNKRNTRGPDGQSMPRHTTTRKVLESEKERKPNMQFCLYVDSSGFYFTHKEIGAACREHQFHRHLGKGELRPKSRLIPKEAQRLIRPYLRNT